MTTIGINEENAGHSGSSGDHTPPPTDRHDHFRVPRGGYTVVGSSFDQWPEPPDLNLVETPLKESVTSFDVREIAGIIRSARDHSPDFIVKEVEALVARARERQASS